MEIHDEKKTLFQINSKVLLEATKPLATLVSGTPVLPILNSFLFEINKQELVITASNLAVSVVNKLAINSQGPSIKIAVPGTMLIETLRNLPVYPITIEVNERNYSMVINTFNGRYQIAGENHVDFPTIPVNTNPTAGIKIATKSLKQGVKKTVFTASKEEQQPRLGGVNIALEPGSITFAATDGQRLARYRFTMDLGIKERNVTLPAKALQLLLQLLPEKREQMHFAIEERQMHFWVDGLHLATTLVEESYPDYEQIIPQKHPYQLLVETAALENGLKIIDCYANRATHEMRLHISNNQLKLQAEDTDFANQGENRLSCEYTGPEICIGMNAKLLFEMVKNIDSKKLKLIFNEPQHAVLIVREEQPTDEDMLMLIMPISLPAS